MARGLIGRAWSAAASCDRRLGGFTLRSSQRRTVARIEGALASLGGALLADPPGTGKTVVALAVARDAERVVVIAPAALRWHWERMSARAGVRIEITSHERLSRGAAPAVAPFIIVDEAHHVRTPGTARYDALSRLAIGARVLLLTATPVVNRVADRDALLALFLGAATPTREAVDRCVIRHDTDGAARPALRRLPDLEGDAAVPGLASELARLPPPLPTVEGTAATALIRISLAFAWHSSLAALDATLRRRLQRGGALRDLLLAKRTPTREALRHWAFGDDDTQLAFSELVGSASPADATVPLGALDAHLDAVRAIRCLIEPRVAADSRARADAIRSLAAAHPATRIALLSRHAETVRALHRELRGDAGVVAVTGRGVRTAAGRWTRDEVLEAIGPRAGPLSPTDRRAVRILLATDLLSEGVEMQGVGIIVHADLPWTPARLAQRRGRIVRVGSAEREVRETRFAIPPGAAPLLRLGERLAHKRRASAETLRGPRARAALDDTMSEWAALPAGRRIAAAHAAFSGFVAALAIDGATQLLTGQRRDPPARGWIISTRPNACLRLCRAASPGESAPDPREARRALQRVRRFLSRRAASRALGHAGSPGAYARVVARLDAMLATEPPAQRAGLAALQRGLLERVGERIEVGLDRELASLLRARDGDAAFQRGLAALLDRTRRGVGAQGPPAARPRLIGLLLLTPAAPHVPATPPAVAPSSASPDTAAPR